MMMLDVGEDEEMRLRFGGDGKCGGVRSLCKY